MLHRILNYFRKVAVGAAISAVAQACPSCGPDLVPAPHAKKPSSALPRPIQPKPAEGVVIDPSSRYPDWYAFPAKWKKAKQENDAKWEAFFGASPTTWQERYAKNDSAWLAFWAKSNQEFVAFWEAFGNAYRQFCREGGALRQWLQTHRLRDPSGAWVRFWRTFQEAKALFDAFAAACPVATQTYNAKMQAHYAAREAYWIAREQAWYREQNERAARAAQCNPLEEAYEALGLPMDADEKTVKETYHRLMLVWHPDKCKESDATARAQKLNLAYATITTHLAEKKNRLGPTAQAPPSNPQPTPVA